MYLIFWYLIFRMHLFKKTKNVSISMCVKFCGAEQSFIRFRNGQWGHFHLTGFLRTSLFILFFRFIFFQWMKGFVHKKADKNSLKKNRPIKFAIFSIDALNRRQTFTFGIWLYVYGEHHFFSFISGGRGLSIECATTKKMVMTHVYFTCTPIVGYHSFAAGC